MSVLRLIQKLRALLSLSTDRGDRPEAKTARRMMERLQERHGVVIDDDDLEPAEIFVEADGEAELTILAIIAHVTGVEVHGVADRVRISGPRICCAEAERIFVVVAERYAQLSAIVMLGVMINAVGVESVRGWASALATDGSTADPASPSAKVDRVSRFARAINGEPSDDDRQVLEVVTSPGGAASPMWTGVRRTSRVDGGGEVPQDHEPDHHR